MAEVVFNDWLAQRGPNASNDVNAVRSSAQKFAKRRLGDEAEQQRMVRMALDHVRPDRLNRGRPLLNHDEPRTVEGVAFEWLSGVNPQNIPTRDNAYRSAKQFALRRALTPLQAAAVGDAVLAQLYPGDPAAVFAAVAPGNGNLGVAPPKAGPAPVAPAKAPAQPPPKAPAPVAPAKAPAQPPPKALAPVAPAKAPAQAPAKAPAPVAPAKAPAQPPPKALAPVAPAKAAPPPPPPPGDDEPQDQPAGQPDQQAEEDDDNIGALQLFSERLNYPSASVLHRALSRNNIRVNGQQVKNFVDSQRFRRPFAPNIRRIRPRGPAKAHPVEAGVATLGRPRTRWDVDVVSFPQSESSEGYTHILLVQDAFSRKLWAKLMQSTRGVEVAGLLDQIIEANGAPQEVVIDKGPELLNPQVAAVLERHQTERVVKEVGDYGVSSQIDSAIRGLKRAIALKKAADPGWEWAAHLDDVLDGENERPRPHLLNDNSNEVDSMQNEDVIFSLEKAAADRLWKNQANIRRQATRLRRTGGFEVPTNTRSAFRRGHQARYDAGHRVALVEGNVVIDTRGRDFQARRVRPGPAPDDAPEPPEGSRPSEVHGPTIARWLKSRPGRRATDAVLSQFMENIGLGNENVQALAERLGFHRQAAGGQTYFRAP